MDLFNAFMDDDSSDSSFNINAEENHQIDVDFNKNEYDGSEIGDHESATVNSDDGDDDDFLGRSKVVDGGEEYADNLAGSDDGFFVDDMKGSFNVTYPDERQEGETEEDYDARILKVRWDRYTNKRSQIVKDAIAYVNDIAKHRVVRGVEGKGSGKIVSKLVLSSAVLMDADNLLQYMKYCDTDDIDPDQAPGFTVESCILDATLQCCQKALFPMWDSATADANFKALEILLNIFCRLLKVHPLTATPDGDGFLKDDQKKSKGHYHHQLKNYYQWIQLFKSELVTKDSFYRGMTYLRSVLQYQEDNEGYSEEQKELKVTLLETLDALKSDALQSDEVVELALNSLLSPRGQLLFVPSRETGEIIKSDDDADLEDGPSASTYTHYLVMKDVARARLAGYRRVEILGFVRNRLESLKVDVESTFTMIDGNVCLKTTESFKEVVRGVLRIPPREEAEALNLHGIRFMQIYLVKSLIRHRLIAPIENDAKDLIARDAIKRSSGRRRRAEYPVGSDERTVWRVMDVVYYSLCQINADKAATLKYEPEFLGTTNTSDVSNVAISSIAQQLKAVSEAQRMNYTRHSQFDPKLAKENFMSAQSALTFHSITSDRITGQHMRGYKPKILWKERLMFTRPKHFILDSDAKGMPIQSYDRQTDVFHDLNTKKAIVEFLHDFLKPNFDHLTEGMMEDVNAQARGTTSEVSWDMILRFMALIGWMLRFYRTQIEFVLKHVKIVREYRKKLEMLRKKTNRRVMNTDQVHRPDYSCDLVIEINVSGQIRTVTMDDELLHIVSEHQGYTEDSFVKHGINPIAKQLRPLMSTGALTFYLDFIVTSILRQKKSDLPGPMAATALKVVTEVLDIALLLMTIEGGRLIKDLGMHTLEYLLKLGVGVIVPELLSGYSVSQHEPHLLACSLKVIQQLGKIPLYLEEYGAPDYVLRAADGVKLKAAFRKMIASGYNPLRTQQSEFSRYGIGKDFKYEEVLADLSHEKIMNVLIRSFENRNQHSVQFNATLAYVLNRMIDMRGQTHPEDGCRFLTLPWLILTQKTCAVPHADKSDPLYKFALRLIQYFWNVFKVNKFIAVELLYCKRNSRLEAPMNIGHPLHLESMYYSYTRGADHDAMENPTSNEDGGGGGYEAPVRVRRQEVLAPFTMEENKNLIQGWQQNRNAPTVAAMLDHVHRAQKGRRPKRQLRQRLQQLGILEPFGTSADDIGWTVRAQNIVEMLYGVVSELVNTDSSKKTLVQEWFSRDVRHLLSDELCFGSQLTIYLVDKMNSQVKEIMQRRELSSSVVCPVDLEVPHRIRLEWHGLDEAAHWIFQSLQDDELNPNVVEGLDKPYLEQFKLFAKFPTQPELPSTRRQDRLFQMQQLFESISEKVRSCPESDNRYRSEMESIRSHVESSRLMAESSNTLADLRNGILNGLYKLKCVPGLSLDHFFDITNSIYESLKNNIKSRLAYLKRNFTSFSKSPSELLDSLEGKAIIGGVRAINTIFTVPDVVLNGDQILYDCLHRLLAAVGYFPVTNHYFSTYLHSIYLEDIAVQDKWVSPYWTGRSVMYRYSSFTSVQTIDKARWFLDRYRGYPIDSLLKMIEDPDGYAMDKMMAACNDRGPREGDEESAPVPKRTEKAPRSHVQYGSLHIAALLKHTLLVRRLAESGDAPQRLVGWLRLLADSLEQFCEPTTSDKAFILKSSSSDEDDGHAEAGDSHFLLYIEVVRLLASLGGVLDASVNEWSFVEDDKGEKPWLLISCFKRALSLDLKSLKKAMYRFMKADSDPSGDSTTFRMELSALMQENSTIGKDDRTEILDGDDYPMDDFLADEPTANMESMTEDEQADEPTANMESMTEEQADKPTANMESMTEDEQADEPTANMESMTEEQADEPTANMESMTEDEQADEPTANMESSAYNFHRAKKHRSGVPASAGHQSIDLESIFKLAKLDGWSGAEAKNLQTIQSLTKVKQLLHVR
eukprot:GHVH01014536.1.p1 GENE.GHVH01014536.1~~GHVH01014536.1.p1  ORF type:complete len:1956 (-),score=329.32 GHVH01014536.1:36-5903(-)